jgi:23S rRNA (pseudouridine1915-N3)-methyltransferase
MSEAHLMVVGRLKDSHLEAIEMDYLKRLTTLKLKIHEVKSDAENKLAESKSIIKKINELFKDNKYQLVLLMEHGREYSSLEFSQFLNDQFGQYKHVIFIIAGAEGHGDDLLKIPHIKLSLSKLTFPHKIARILFVEQYYRAQTILNGHPYHN